MAEFSDRLKRAMSECGLRQADLCKLTGIDKSLISNYLSGKYKAKQENLYLIARALGTSEAWLMGLDDGTDADGNGDGSAHGSAGGHGIVDGHSADYYTGRGVTRGKPAAGRALRIPVLGRVAAGIPITAITDFDDSDPDSWEEITEATAKSGEFFALRIRGDSMEPRICNGDVIIVRHQSDVDDGDIAVVLINGDDAVCKKIKKTSRGIIMISINSAYEPIFFSCEEIASLPVTVIGRVVELRAKFS